MLKQRLKQIPSGRAFSDERLKNGKRSPFRTIFNEKSKKSYGTYLFNLTHEFREIIRKNLLRENLCKH